MASMFPSPLGVSYFQIIHSLFSGGNDEDMFPSPLGVSYFQIKERTYSERFTRWFVSVPSRGILFPNVITIY